MNSYKTMKKHLLAILLLSTLIISACGSGGGSETDVSGPGDGGTLPPIGSVSTLSANLTWDPSPGDYIAGYKVYYSTDENNFPIGVFGANEGTSPIDVGDMTEATLSGLLSNEIHYFAVTAYDEFGNESTFSNVVSTQ